MTGQTNYKFQYCTLWNKTIPGVVLRSMESDNSNDVWFDFSIQGNSPEYRLGGSFLCNSAVNIQDLEKPIKGIEGLLMLQKKYEGQLNVLVTIPLSEYLSVKNLELPRENNHSNFGSAGGCDSGAIG